MPEAKNASLRDRLQAGENVFGPFLKIPASAPAELIAYAGFHFCVIDLEHSPFSFERAEEIVRAAQGAGLSTVIRSFDYQPSTLSRCLDTGCDALLVPNVETREEAEQVVSGARFHPLGKRGMDPRARSARFGTIPSSVYFGQEIDPPLLAVQIEGLRGIQNLDDILQVEGFDMVFIGPYDLSQSLGIPGQVNALPVLERTREIVTSVKAKGKVVGIYADKVEEARRWRDLGIQFIATSVDVNLFYTACEAMVRALHT
jgi:4-hydroxy-2-oxoheptanedioate aldolase